MRGLRRCLFTGALTGGLAFAGAVGSAAAEPAPAPWNTAGVTVAREQGQAAPAHRAADGGQGRERGTAGVLAWSCGSWAEILPPGLWGRSCRNSVPAQGAGEAYNGRSYNVRFRVVVKSRTPWGDANLGSCDSWVAPGGYFWCGDFYLSPALSPYPVVATFQQLEP